MVVCQPGTCLYKRTYWINFSNQLPCDLFTVPPGEAAKIQVKYITGYNYLLYLLYLSFLGHVHVTVNSQGNSRQPLSPPTPWSLPL